MQENIVATILFLVSLLEEFQVVLPNLIVVDAELIASWESELKLWTTQVDFINYTSESTDAREFIQQAEFNFPNGPIKPQMILTTFEVLNSVRRKPKFFTARDLSYYILFALRYQPAKRLTRTQIIFKT
jgi:SNF2 family DNA or RNA helicase